MNVNQIIDGILEREGPGEPPYLAKNDAGGRTSWGISERSHPEAWRPGPPTKEQAQAIYRIVYIAPFFALSRVFGADPLIDVLVDDAVMSGVPAAIKRLQSVLGLDIDGVLGPKTLDAIRTHPMPRIIHWYVIERVVRITRLVEKRPADLTNLTGWVTRILGFLPEV